jgi:hypothetical protein
MPRRPLVVAACLSFLILLTKLAFPAPALSDPTGSVLPVGMHLAFPFFNLFFAPLFDLWDGVTLLAMPRLNAFLLGAVTLGAAWSVGSSIVDGKLSWSRATARLALFILGLGAFVLGGIRWRRPMAHLSGVPSGVWVVDLHSHTNVSHDVKGWLQRDFDLETSRRWHARGGFDAFFVTDHNRTDGWTAARVGDHTLPPPPVACPGEELSLWRAHIVVLGNTDSIPQSLYSDSAAGIARLFRESESRWGGVTLASIPEYDENHFADLSRWIADGVDGFEISNAAPKANRQTIAHRDSVVLLARAGNRWLAGVTDQHGMGATAQTWTLIPRTPVVPTSRAICQQILGTLRTRGFDATKVVERHRLRLDSPWPLFATVIAVPWEGWRAAGPWQIMSWLAWVWGATLLASRRARKATT